MPYGPICAFENCGRLYWNWGAILKKAWWTKAPTRTGAKGIVGHLVMPMLSTIRYERFLRVTGSISFYLAIWEAFAI